MHALSFHFHCTQWIHSRAGSNQFTGMGAGGPHLDDDWRAAALVVNPLHTMETSTLITEAGRGPGGSSDSGATWPGATPHFPPRWLWTSLLQPARRKSSRADETKPSPGGRKPVCNGRCAQTSRFGWGGYLAQRKCLTLRRVLHTLQVIDDLERREKNDQGEARISQQVLVR